MPVGIRIALWTPLPPLHNGIADYSVELLAYLSRRYDIAVFIDKGYEPTSWLTERYPIFRYTDFAKHHQQRPFDLIIYQLGGSHSHHYMFDAIQKWPGLVVLHDLLMGMSLYKFYAQRASTNQRFARYLRQEGAQIEQEFKSLLRLRGAAHDAAVETFFNEHYLLDWIVKASLAQIVHMEYAAREISHLYPNAHPHVVHMGVQKPDLSVSAEAMRSRFGIAPSTFVIGVFGRINKYKGHQICLEAVQKLRVDHPDILVVIVGPHIQSDYFDQLRAMVDSSGMKNHVHFAGYLDQSQFDQVLHVCDVIVNLRYPGQMQMSATLIRALAAAKPVIISDIPEWEMLPDAACVRLVHGENDVDTLKEHLRRLLVDPALRQTISLNAQRYVDEHATLAVMGSQYERLIAQYTSKQTAASTRPDHDSEPIPSTLDRTPRLPTQSSLPLLPVEEVSLPELHQLLGEWHQLQKASAPPTIIKRMPRFVEFLQNVARRVRYLGTAWQIQGSLYEALTQRQESLSRTVEYLTEQTTALKAELDQLRQALNDHPPTDKPDKP